jgi:hypothetical protein
LLSTKTADQGSGEKEDIAMGDDFAMAIEQVGLGESAVELL